LRELAVEGRLQRVHGGALPSAQAAADLDTRLNIASASKQRVGKLAAGLIKSNSVVILDGGSTTLQIVRHLPLDHTCTVVTHSPSIAVALSNHHRVKLIMVGGVLFRHSMVNVGAAAIESMSHIRADCYFMGITGLSVEEGLSTGDLEEAHIKRALSERAAETVVLASEEKLGVASPYVVMPLEHATGVILNGKKTRHFVSACKRLGLDVHRS
jgi:DeoR/GlpR family transcriptional regulator of sugar metabolism